MPFEDSGKSENELNNSGSCVIWLIIKFESQVSVSIDWDEIELGDQIARGGYGTVYKAHWRTNEVAVKILNVAIEDLSPKEVDDVKRELKLMGKLNQSHIITYMGSTQISVRKNKNFYLFSRTFNRDNPLALSWNM